MAQAVCWKNGAERTTGREWTQGYSVFEYIMNNVWK
jgi:hypothetical protein